MVDQRSPPDEIIALRDGEQTSKAFRLALHRDRGMLLDLADARLLAVALSLPAEPNPDDKWSLPPDEELTSYLLDRQPADSRSSLEAKIRGNPRAFKRLLELRDALVTATGQPRDEIPASWHKREAREPLGTARVRAANGRLEFSPDHTMRDKLVAASGDQPVAAFQPPRAALGLTQSPLPFKEAYLSRSAFQDMKGLETGLGGSLREFRLAIDQFGDALQLAAKMKTSAVNFQELRDLIDSAHELAGKVPTVADNSEPTERSRERNILHSAFLAEFSTGLDPQLKRATETHWHATLSLQGGKTCIDLAGSAGPLGHLQLLLRGSDGVPLSEKLVTLVRPRRQGFESAETDRQGECTLTLGEGESVLLLEEDRTLELRLRYKPQRKSSAL